MGQKQLRIWRGRSAEKNEPRSQAKVERSIKHTHTPKTIANDHPASHSASSSTPPSSSRCPHPHGPVLAPPLAAQIRLVCETVSGGGSTCNHPWKTRECCG